MPSNSNYTLEYMRMGPKDLYLCLIPKPLDHTPSVAQEDLPELETTPSRSWSLLESLSGTCLYVGPFLVCAKSLHWLIAASIQSIGKDGLRILTAITIKSDSSRKLPKLPVPQVISSLLIILQSCACIYLTCLAHLAFPVGILRC